MRNAPEKVKFIEDINTGEAFLESYKNFITKPNQVPLGIIFFIDGAVTGQFSDLPITALKISLSIHNWEARDHEWAWRELAWIPQVRKQKARGKKLVKELKHLESFDLELLDGEGDYAELDDEDADTTDEDTEPAVTGFPYYAKLCTKKLGGATGNRFYLGYSSLWKFIQGPGICHFCSECEMRHGGR